VHALYHGHGDGRFSDVAAELGIARSGEQGGRGQGVVASDVNNDGHIDLYVANDLSPNFLFINTGHGGFEDQTEISCAAYNAEGQSEASMGVDAADVDGDGLPELFVTNFYHEHNTLYRNLSKPGNTLFQDVSQWTGVAAGSMLYVGWGTGFEDLDGDGWLDIFVTNGHVDDNLDKLSRDEPYAQPPAVWRNAGKGQFEKFLEEAGPYFGTKHVGRGAAFGDLDNDGQVDIVVSYKDERPTVLHNESRAHAAQPNAWTQLRMIGTRSNRDGIGVRVEIEAGEKRWTREIRGGRSYLSAHDLRLTIGLGDAPRIDRLIVHWPSGQVSRLENLDVNRPYTIREPVAAPPVASP
jgi:hypothetical protein